MSTSFLYNFLKETQRKRFPNLRSVGGLYWTDTFYEPDDRTVPFFQGWHDWNCARCKFDFLTNKEQTMEALNAKKPVPHCDMQADIILNHFERHRVPEDTLVAMGMNRYGIGTCALFEEYMGGENNGS